MGISEQSNLKDPNKMIDGVTVSESGELSVFRTFYEAMDMNQLKEEENKLDTDIQALREKKYNIDNVNNRSEVIRNDVVLDSYDLHFVTTHDDLDALMARKKMVDSLLENTHIGK